LNEQEAGPTSYWGGGIGYGWKRLSMEVVPMTLDLSKLRLTGWKTMLGWTALNLVRVIYPDAVSDDAMGEVLSNADAPQWLMVGIQWFIGVGVIDKIQRWVGK